MKKHLLQVCASGMLLASLCACSSTPPAAPPAWQAPSLPLPAGAVLLPPGQGRDTLPDTETVAGSLKPDQKTAAERIPGIVARGHLIVGVAGSQNLMSFQDPETSELKGFEVDLARGIAASIFGDPARVDFRFVSSDDYLQALNSGAVDMVLHTLTITKERQSQMAFSVPYFTADSYLLTKQQAGISSIGDIGTGTVCATANSTGAATARVLGPKVTVLATRSSSDCLVALQQDQTAAIISDLPILAGINAQDPYTQIVGGPLFRGNYGIAFAQPSSINQVAGLIRQTNEALVKMMNDGTWWRLYNQWLAPYMTTQGPPTPTYVEEQS